MVVLFISYSLLKPIQVFDGVWNHNILSIMVSKYFRNIFNWEVRKLWDCLFKCLITLLHQIMSITLYQHELLWDICNARGMIIVVYSGIKEDLSQITFHQIMNLDAVLLVLWGHCLGVDIHSSPVWLTWDICSQNLMTQGEVASLPLMGKSL